MRRGDAIPVGGGALLLLRVVSRVAHVHGVGVLRVLLLLLSGALVYGRLHLLQNLVNLLEVVFGAEVRHGRQVVMLRQGSRSVSYAGSEAEARWVGGDELLCRHRPAHGRVQGSMDGHQGPADLAVRRGIDLTTLDDTKEVVELTERTLGAAIEGYGRLVAHLVAARVHGRRLVVVQRLVGLGLVVRVVATVTVLMRLAKVCRVSADSAVMVIVA